MVQAMPTMCVASTNSRQCPVLQCIGKWLSMAQLGSAMTYYTADVRPGWPEGKAVLVKGAAFGALEQPVLAWHASTCWQSL